MKAVRVGFLGAALALAGCQNTGETSSLNEAEMAQGSNRAFSHTRETQASPDEIWVLWTDVSTWKSWDKGLADAELDGPMGLGAIGRIIPSSGPASRFEVTAWAPNQSYTFETRLPLARLSVTRSFVSLDPVTFRHDVEFKGVLSGFWAARLGPQFRAALPSTMDALAERAETDQVRP